MARTKLRSAHKLNSSRMRLLNSVLKPLLSTSPIHPLDKRWVMRLVRLILSDEEQEKFSLPRKTATARSKATTST
jgi:hypothetical protein